VINETLRGRKVIVSRSPEGLSASSSWEEDFVVTSVRDIYHSATHGRVIEFFTSSHQTRTVPVTNLRVVGGIPTRLRQAYEGA
jgi:hypothetical protein